MPPRPLGEGVENNFLSSTIAVSFENTLQLFYI
jgi:hypothetical protein